MPSMGFPWFDGRDKKTGPEAETQGEGSYFGYLRVSRQEKMKRVIEHFNTIAKRYDMMNTLLSFGIHLLWKRTAVKVMNLKTGEQVIDVCGGTGDLSILASKSVGPSGRVILYDMNRKMIDIGRSKFRRLPWVENIVCVQGDAEEICFPDQTFDGAMVAFGVRNLTRPHEGFKEIYRVLKPGGRMMCLEFSTPVAPLFRWLYDFYSFHIMPVLGELFVGSRQAYTYLPESIRTFPMPETLSELLREIGFCQVRYRRLSNGIAVIHLGIKEGSGLGFLHRVHEPNGVDGSGL